MTKIKRNPDEYKAKRLQLMELSQTAKQLRTLCNREDLPLNHFIVQIYKKEKPGTFNTFHEWKRLGKSVNKGEKGFAVWGSPIRAKVNSGIIQEGEVTQKEMEYFPLCYLFHESQVSDEVEKNKETEREEEAEELVFIPTRSTFTHQKVGSC